MEFWKALLDVADHELAEARKRDEVGWLARGAGWGAHECAYMYAWHVSAHGGLPFVPMPTHKV